MLTRVASSLYWAGRYIERSEHLSRYLKVQYFSTLDAPVSQQKEVILKSILYMGAGAKMLKASETEVLNEPDILEEFAFNLENQSSIFSTVKAARENARSVRYILSSELWEVINCFYHYVKDYSVEFYKTRGLYDFTTNVTQHTSVIQSYIDRTLLYDDIWIFLKLGIHIERCTQILRILNSKIIDINLLTGGDAESPLTNYQWTTTLKIMETFDMYRRFYRGNVTQENVVSFLLSQPTLSRSLAYNLKRIQELLSKLSFAADTDSQLAFQAGKMAGNFKFLEYSEIEDSLQPFLVGSLGKIYQLHDLIEKEYFE